MTDFINGVSIGDAPTEYAPPFWLLADQFTIQGEVGPTFYGDLWDRYAFVAPSSGQAAFLLTGLYSNLDLVLEDENGQVVAASLNGGNYNDGFYYTLERGKVYYIDVAPLYGESIYTLYLDFADVPLRDGTAANDTLTGTAVDEYLYGRAGGDRISGGGGYDTAFYNGLSKQYRFGVEAGLLTVKDVVTSNGNEGTDRVSGVEALRFNDREFYVTGSGATLKLYGTAADDVINVAGGGTLAVDAGGGRDIAVFRGNAADYGFSVSDGTVTVRDLKPSDGDDGIRTLNSFETLRFADHDLLVTGGEFRVNTTTARSQEQPAVAALENGDYVVTWASSGGANGVFGIYAQRFSATGVALGPELRVNTNTATAQFEPDVAGTSDGGFVVVWSLQGDTGATSSIQFRRYDASGVAKGNPAMANLASAGYEFSPSVTALTAGGFAIAWSTSEGNDSGFEIHARRFDANGTRLGSELQANTSEAGEQFATSVTTLASGGYVVSWISIDGAGVPSTWFQRYGATGAVLGVNTRVAVNSDPIPGFNPNDASQLVLTDLNIAPKVEALSDGGFVVNASWFNTGMLDYQSSLHVFNANGTVRGSPHLLSNGTGFNTAMTVLADDTIVVAWPVHGAGGYFDMYTRRFDHTGAPLGAAVLVNSNTFDNQFVGAMTALNGGGYVVTWTSGGQDLSEYGVFAQQYQDNGDTVRVEVRGTDGADVLFYIGDDAMQAFGFKGDDIYIVQRAADEAIEAPGEGTDTVKAGLSWTLAANLENLVLTSTANDSAAGNSQANRITGNEGNNTIDGAAGTDTMEGGTGDDTYYVDSAADEIIEAAAVAAKLHDPASGGSDTDTVIALVSYTLRANVENLQLAGTSNLTGTGNELDNVLTGNDGANRLGGQNGADLISGSKGNDTLVGGAQNDTLQGGAGADRFLFDRALAGNLDTLVDFVHLVDRIALDDDVFDAFDATVSTALDIAQLWIGAAAHDADDRIVYRPSNGALYYDPDGNGPVAAIRFATLGVAVHPATLAVADFVIVG